jgi:uncharacterized Fe-S radical SAM superfamily protein PflX
MGRGFFYPTPSDAQHVECCTYPVPEWIAEHVSAAPVNVMAQFHPDFLRSGERQVPGEICRDRTPTNA